MVVTIENILSLDKKKISHMVGQNGHKYKDLVFFIDNYIDSEHTTQEKLMLIFKGISVPPRCICGEFVKITTKKIYKTCCTKKCVSNSKITTYMESTGYPNPSKNPEVKFKKEETYFNKTGYSNPSQNNELIESKKFNRLNRFNSKTLKITLNDTKYGRYYFTCNRCNGQFDRSSSGFGQYINRHIDPCPKCNPRVYSFASSAELSLGQYITSIYNRTIIFGYRHGRLELDIFLPDINIGFEFNGIYWHSLRRKQVDYHYNKKKYFSKNGIHIIQIWEDDWSNRKTIIESMIRQTLSLNIIIDKIETHEIDEFIAKSFFDENSIYDFIESGRYFGLYNSKMLVHVIVVDNDRVLLSDNLIGYSVINPLIHVLPFVNKIIISPDLDWYTYNITELLDIGFLKQSLSEPSILIKSGNQCPNSGHIEYVYDK